MQETARFPITRWRNTSVNHRTSNSYDQCLIYSGRSRNCSLASVYGEGKPTSKFLQRFDYIIEDADKAVRLSHVIVQPGETNHCRIPILKTERGEGVVYGRRLIQSTNVHRGSKRLLKISWELNRFSWAISDSIDAWERYIGFSKAGKHLAYVKFLQSLGIATHTVYQIPMNWRALESK